MPNPTDSSKEDIILDRVFSDLKKFNIQDKVEYKQLVHLGYQVAKNKEGELRQVQITIGNTHVYYILGLVETGINSKRTVPFCFFIEGVKAGMGYVLPLPYSEYETFVLNVIKNKDFSVS